MYGQTWAWATPEFKFHVHYGLRGLDEIAPEEYGDDSDLLRYLTEVGKRRQERWKTSGLGKLDPAEIAQQLVASYGKWTEKTHGWTSNMPNRSSDVYVNIHDVKLTISETHATVLMVTDPKMASYMLMGLLPSDETDSAKVNNLKSGRIEKVPLLADAGLLQVKWREVFAQGQKAVKAWQLDESVAFFTSVNEASEDGEPRLPVYSTRSMPVPLDDYSWAMEEVRAKLPFFSTWYTFDMTKQKRKLMIIWTKARPRRVTVAWKTHGGRAGYIAWSSPFGETWKGYTDMSEVDVTETGGKVVVKNRRTGERWKFNGEDSVTNQLFADKIREGQQIIAG